MEEKMGEYILYIACCLSPPTPTPVSCPSIMHPLRRQCYFNPLLPLKIFGGGGWGVGHDSQLNFKMLILSGQKTHLSVFHGQSQGSLSQENRAGVGVTKKISPHLSISTKPTGNWLDFILSPPTLHSTIYCCVQTDQKLSITSTKHC